MMMRYIKRKDSPLIIRAFGYVPPGGLGDFDPDTYEEVEGDLPEGWQLEATPKTLNQTLEEAFLQMLPGHLGQPYMADSVIASIMTAKVAVIDANKIDTSGTLAKSIINGLSLPSELESDRQALLSLFDA